MMPFGVDFDLAQGIMKDPQNHVVRRASSMRGHYRDGEALEALIAKGDPVHYEVFERNVPEEQGQLRFCISKTFPGTVGGECFMTKGHYHAVSGTAEIYLCLRGEGYMLMKLPTGESAFERFLPGRLCYVPPFWAHRTVNTGDEPLISLCVYPAEAGHNYGDIEREGFPLRVFMRGGKAEIVKQAHEQAAAGRRTMLFIGVHTQSSMIMRVFPKWAAALHLGDCTLEGIDLALHDLPARYREVVRAIKEDPLVVGGLVTTHKIDLVHAARDMFDSLDPLASLMGEVSAISKRGGWLHGSALDPITSGRALAAMLPKGYWERTRADAFIMGAGGSSIALSWHLGHPERGSDHPARIFISNRSPGRLEEMKRIHAASRLRVPIEYVLTPDPADNDRVLARLAPGSLVANATGLGKDAPGSPLTDAAVFPQAGVAWDFNYRGELVFLRQARGQERARGLRVEDGWMYFLAGWLAVMGEIFAKDIPLQGPEFERLRAIAEAERK